MSSLARWCVRHRAVVLALWLVALFGFLAADLSAKAAYSTKFSLPDTPSSNAIKILQSNFPTASGEADQIVLAARTGTLLAPDTVASAQRMLASLKALPHVADVASPYDPTARAARMARGDGIAFATITFDAQGQNLPLGAVRKVISTATAADSPSLQVELGGQSIEQALPMRQSNSTVLGIVVAFIVLLLAFGALFAAFLPLITALVAIGTGYAITGLLSHVISVASFATILGALIGLGVGVDYALFIVTRHRTGLRAGRGIEDSVANAANTAGRAVFFAGLTVCIALLGQFALGVSFLYGVATTAAVTVALTMLASLTLLPALLGFFKTRALSRRERARLAASGPVSEVVTGFWRRWALGVARRPALRGAASLLVMVIVALPVLTLRLGLSDAGSDPTTTTTRQAYDLLARGFGEGFNGPFQLVARISSPGELATFSALTTALGRQPGVVAVTPPQLSPTGRAALAILYPSTAPQAASTSVLLTHLRNDVVPRAEAGGPLRVLIGGATAAGDDFSHVLSSKLPLFVAVVVVLAFILLMAVFRSLVIPAVASVMNLLSVGAALGIMNVTFEWGWGSSILGIARTGPVEVFIPVIMFSILFGLSMDYEVFLVSRIQEEWTIGRDNTRAVTTGQAETGRVITAAAMIMILVFASFVFGGSLIIKQFGIGLAGAIVIDAFIVRTLLVPSIMQLCGAANWWLPRWLDRALPRLNVEVADEPIRISPPPEPVGTSS